MKTFLHVTLRILLYLLGMLLLATLFTMPLVLLTPKLQRLAHGVLFYELSQRLAVLIAAIIPAWLLLKYDGGQPFLALGLSLKGRAGQFLGGAFTALLIYLVGFTVALLTGTVKVTAVHADVFSLSLSLPVMLLVAVAEEVAVRGYLLGRMLEAGLPRYAALLVSSALFACMHLLNPHIGLLPLLNIFLAGCLLGVAYLYTRNLWYAIGLHLFWNWLQGPLLGYEVSGTGLGTSLFTLRLHGNDLFTGGAFGFEGSLICTVVTVVAILWVDWYQRRFNPCPPHARSPKATC
ncbi:MAG: CPBP family intramembrane metalloprotease [Prevotellaceae bacterium]|nr:CPBP family intramembrane metalloprotease [Prevotellaceae bacterium]